MALKGISARLFTCGIRKRKASVPSCPQLVVWCMVAGVNIALALAFFALADNAVKQANIVLSELPEFELIAPMKATPIDEEGNVLPPIDLWLPIREHIPRVNKVVKDINVSLQKAAGLSETGYRGAGIASSIGAAAALLSLFVSLRQWWAADLPRVVGPPLESAQTFRDVHVKAACCGPTPLPPSLGERI